MAGVNWQRAEHLDGTHVLAAHLKRHGALENYEIRAGYTVWSTKTGDPVAMVIYTGAGGCEPHAYVPAKVDAAAKPR